MRFISRDGKISAANGDKIIFSGLKGYIMTEENIKTYLEEVEFNGDNIVFSSERLGASLTVSFRDVNTTTAIEIEAHYHPVNGLDSKFNNHFFEEHAAGVEIEEMPTLKRFSLTWLRLEFWARAAFPERLSEIPAFTQSMIMELDDTKAFLMAVSDKEYNGSFVGSENGGFSIYVWNNCLSNDCKTTAAVIGFCDDIYSLPERVVADGLTAIGKSAVMRKDKKYPEILEYLGWCSWDAFKLDVSHDRIIAKVQELKDKNIPVRWAMIDDMWGDVDNLLLGQNSSRELKSFKADKKRFPKGLEGITEKLHKDFGLKVGLWHPTTGYWNGIDPTSELANGELKDMLFWSQSGILMHKFDADAVEKYYLKQHKYYSDCGIDLIKVDNQACLRKHCKRVMPIGRAAENMHNAIEKTAETYYGGALINCMGMPIENFWHRNSSVIRMSCDFQGEDRTRFNLIIVQDAFNSMVQGTLYYGDWDMWWSDDSQALKSALSHAVSGGPIYVSDELDRSKAEVIMPLVLEDGRILRMKSPARPCYDSLFEDPLTSKKPFKIFNKQDGNGVVVAYNLDKDGKGVNGHISALDAGLTEKRYCVYNYVTGEAFEALAEQKIEISLSGENDVVMLVFIPLTEAGAIIGLKEKYIGFLGVEDGEALQDGNLLVYGNNEIKINGCRTMIEGDGKLYSVFVNKGDRVSLE